MIEHNLKIINESIHNSANRVKRSPSAIKLVAVSKRKEVAVIRQAYDCGQMVFGENYLQEAADKIPHLPNDIQWHFIGHLQSNKAKLAAAMFDVIETVDSVKLATLLYKHAVALDKKLSVLLQVNIGLEKQKAGISPEETESILYKIREQTELHVAGLMVLPPFNPDPESNRPYFVETRKLAEQLALKGLFSDNEKFELSMGMSGDFPVAIEEGATIIRVGTALFGARDR